MLPHSSRRSSSSRSGTPDNDPGHHPWAGHGGIPPAPKRQRVKTPPSRLSDCMLVDDDDDGDCGDAQLSMEKMHKAFMAPRIPPPRFDIHAGAPPLPWDAPPLEVGDQPPARPALDLRLIGSQSRPLNLTMDRPEGPEWAQAAPGSPTRRPHRVGFNPAYHDGPAPSFAEMPSSIKTPERLRQLYTPASSQQSSPYGGSVVMSTPASTAPSATPPRHADFPPFCHESIFGSGSSSASSEAEPGPATPPPMDPRDDWGERRMRLFGSRFGAVPERGLDMRLRADASHEGMSVDVADDDAHGQAADSGGLLPLLPALKLSPSLQNASPPPHTLGGPLEHVASWISASAAGTQREACSSAPEARQCPKRPRLARAKPTAELSSQRLQGFAETGDYFHDWESLTPGV